MCLVEALRVPVSEDLRGFLSLLRHFQVPCRVSEEADEQVLRVPSNWVAQVIAWYQQYPQGLEALHAVDSSPKTKTASFKQLSGLYLRNYPVTLGVLGLTALVALVTQLGTDFNAVHWLSFVDFRLQGDALYFAPWFLVAADHQWWRLITPAFVHFGMLHWIMNSLWFWELGRRIEQVQGHWGLIWLVLGFALLTNVAQYVWTDLSLFGGLSGVVYGLLGYCWWYQRLRPTPAFQLPSGVVGLMLAWLIICATGLVDVLSFGLISIANAAHVVGLLAGCIAGALAARWSRSSF